MMWLVYTLIAVFLLFVVLLFIPVQFEIDTTHDYYAMRYGFLVSSALVPADGKLFFRLRIFGFSRERSLNELIMQVRRPVIQSVVTNAQKKPSPRKRIRLQKVFSVIRNIDIRRLYINIDTGNYLLNAWLFPLCFPFDAPGRKLRINFNGQTIVRASVQAVPAKLLWAFLRA